VYIEGALETRKFTDRSGAERETTEVVLKAFRGELAMLDSRNDGERQPAPRQDAAPQVRQDDSDSIPL
jgi:single-strand DNA-binding protein